MPAESCSGAQTVPHPVPPGEARPPRGAVEEHRLVLACAAGDREALEQLYDRFAGLLLALIHRILGHSGAAEEVLHEAFLYVWDRASTYDPQKSSVSTWLVLIARSRAIDRLRRNRTKNGVRARVRSEQASRSEPPRGRAAVLDAERRQSVRAAMQRLPEGQRCVLELAYYEGLTQAEIAQKIRTPLGMVKTRTALALRQLRTALAPEIRGLLGVDSESS